MTTTDKPDPPALALLKRHRSEEAERKAQIAARRQAKADHDAQFIAISKLVDRVRNVYRETGVSYGMIVFETLRSDDRHEGGITPLFCRWAAWNDWTAGRDERDWHPDDARWTPLPPCPVKCFCRLSEGEGAKWGQEYTHINRPGSITSPDPLLSALAQYGFDVELLAKLGNGRGGRFNAGALAIRTEDAARLFGPEVVAEPEPVVGPVETVPVRNAGTPTVQDAIASHVAKLMRERPDHTAETLYQQMRRGAGGDDSPFARLAQGGELFCVEAGKPCGIASVRAALTRYRKGRRSTVEVPSNP